MKIILELTSSNPKVLENFDFAIKQSEDFINSKYCGSKLTFLGWNGFAAYMLDGGQQYA